MCTSTLGRQLGLKIYDFCTIFFLKKNLINHNFSENLGVITVLFKKFVIKMEAFVYKKSVRFL